MPSESAETATRTAKWLNVLSLVVLWLLLLNELRGEWTFNPQYNYGWVVPGLVLYLFWKRWPDRPAPEAPASSWPIRLWAGALLLAWLPVYWLQEANPHWRLTSWAAALTVVQLNLLALWYAGGWRWVKHFVIPVAFILLAVGWPTRIEQALIHQLMLVGTAGTVEAMNWLGIAALQRGNIIELTNGAVGVDDACSGIRSFQATLMVALFFGELYRMRVGARTGLLLAGLLGAVILNFLRTAFLAWIYAQKGVSAYTQWHDRAGYFTLGMAVALVGIMAFLWQRRSDGTGGSPVPPAPGLSTMNAPASEPAAGRWLPAPVAAMVLAWLTFTIAATEGWYRFHERKYEAAVAWTVVWPSAEEGFHLQELSEKLRRALGSDESEAGIWLKAGDRKWEMFFLRWQARRQAARMARVHNPEACLPAAGFKLRANLGTTPLQVADLMMPFNTYIFERDERTWYVFFCVLDDRVARGSVPGAVLGQTIQDHFYKGWRWRAAWDGRRHFGQQVLEVAMSGYASREEAHEALQEALPRLIRVDSEVPGARAHSTPF